VSTIGTQYLELCENSLLEQAFVGMLEQPDIRVVSFDLFDTLFFRRCATPEQVFRIVGGNESVAHRFGDASTFAHYRRMAEEQARRSSPYEEVSLSGIYEQLPLEAEFRQRLIELELAEERRQLYPNAQLERWLEMAKAHNKKVIVTSDIYLTEQQLGMVALDGWKGGGLVDELYVSSMEHKTKASGTLFNLIMEREGLVPEQVLHIGDKLDADVTVPQGFGMHALHYAPSVLNARVIENESIYLGVADETGNDIRQLSVLLDPFEDPAESFFFSLGAQLFGPVLWRFSYWLLELSNKQGIHQIVSVMREGRTFHRCLQHCLERQGERGNLRATLLYASRKSTYLPSLQGDDGPGNFNRYREMSVADLYGMHGIQVPESEVGEMSLTGLNKTLSGEFSLGEWIRKDFANRSSELDKSRRKAGETFRRYCRDLNIDDDAILVDFGGTGSVLQQIGRALGNATFTNVLFFMHDDGYRQMLSTPARPFLPLNRRTSSAIEAIRRSPEVLEILLNGTAKSTLGYKTKGDKVVPVLDDSPTKESHARHIIAFDAGIDAFFSAASQHGLAHDVFEHERLALMLGRLVESPEPDEARWLGLMPLCRGYGDDSGSTLLDETQQKFVSDIGAERCYREFVANSSAYYEALPWPQGAITVIDPDCIRKLRGMASRSINQNAIDKLIERITSENINSLSIFGAGEFFRQLLPHIIKLGVKVNFVIDSRAYTGDFAIEGYDVVTPEYAINRGETIFLIASVAFAEQMAKRLNNMIERSTEVHILSV